MSWVSTREIWKGRGGSQDDSNLNNSDRVFRVQMSSPFDDEIAVAQSYGGPVLFDKHPNRPRLWVQNVDIRNMDESAYLWVVHVTYSSQVKDPNQWKETPLDKPMKDRWGHNSFTLPAVEGYLFDPETDAEATEKTAITNSAGEAFDPPVERNASRLTISCEVNLADPPSWILDYNDVLNSDTVTIRGITFEPYMLRINTRVSDVLVENGIPYRQVSYDLEARKETFLKKIPDRGYNGTAYGTFGKLTNANGLEPSQPLYLDGTGRQAGAAIGTLAAGSDSLTITASSGAFTSDDVGGSITVYKAGVMGGTPPAATAHNTTIKTFIDETHVTLEDPGITLANSAYVRWTIGKPRFRKYRVDEAKPFEILSLPS